MKTQTKPGGQEARRKHGRTQSRKPGKLAGHKNAPSGADSGWQPWKESGIRNPGAGRYVIENQGVLRHSEEDGYYLFDDRRECTLNGKPSDEFALWRCNTEALRDPKSQGKLKLTFGYGPAVPRVKRLTYTEALWRCIQSRIPAEFHETLKAALKTVPAVVSHCPGCRCTVQFLAGHAPGAHVADVECPHCHGAEIPFSTRVILPSVEGRKP